MQHGLANSATDLMGLQQLKTEYTSLWESYQQVQLKYNKIYDERVRAWLALSKFHKALKINPGAQAFGTFIGR